MLTIRSLNETEFIKIFLKIWKQSDKSKMEQLEESRK